MKKILISALAYDGGKSGIANYIENVVKALSVNLDIELIVNKDEEKYFKDISKNITFRVVPPYLKKPLFSALWHLFILPFKIKKDDYQWMLLPAGNRRLMSFYPLKTFVTMHDLSQFHVEKKYDMLRMFYIKYFIPFFLKKADKIFTVSQNTANDITKYYGIPNKELIVNYNGVNTENFSFTNTLDKKTMPSSQPYILYVARIEHPGKNHLNLIKAYEMLPELYKQHYDLYLIGSDWNGAEVVHQYAEASADVKRIKFLGFINNDDLIMYYRNATLFAFPSFYEGFGIPIVEAMASNVAVVVSNTSSLPEVGGDAALYFNPNSPRDIAKTMFKVLADPCYQEEMRKLGLKQVKKFNWNKHAEIIQTTANTAIIFQNWRNNMQVLKVKTHTNNVIKKMFPIAKEVYLRRINIMGVNFLNTTMVDAIERIKFKIKNKEKSNIYYINADTLNKCYSNTSLRTMFNKASYVFPDGSGVKMACKIMRRPLRENLNGTDMLPHICTMAQEEGYKIFLYGAKEGIAKQMKESLLVKYPSLKIVGIANGYDLHTNEIINMVNYSSADILLVAKGAPIQEEWIDANSSRISAPIIIGVGGLFDFYSGNIPRAPLWMRKLGVEWTYRLLQEPKRMFKRYVIGNPLFLIRMRLWNAKLKKEHLKGYSKDNLLDKMKSTLANFSRLNHSSYHVSKRILDIFASAIGLIILSPLLLLVSILIKLESKGSIFFHQVRVGCDGKLFNMYKFRSMVQNAEQIKDQLSSENESNDGVIFKMKNDPRITKMGKFIRKWSIDELPQLINVLKGDMSLVGPRPPVPSEVKEYVSDDLKRLHTIPGITCYWQIAGRSEIPFKQQVDLDKKYISTCSLWTDIKILFATVPAVLAHKGAY